MKELLLIEASGSHYEIGFTVGKLAKHKLLKSINNYHTILPEEGWDKAWVLPGEFLEAANEAYPHLVEELQGMADGAGIDFSDLFFLNSLEEVLELNSPKACSTAAISSSKGVWLGHNEDWYAADCDSIIAIYAKPRGKPAFISITAAPYLSAVGVNEAGLSQGINSLSPTDCKTGIPRVFVSRAVLEAGSFDDAVKAALPDNRAGGYNHLIAYASGAICNLETSADDYDCLSGDYFVYHTNHYTSPNMIKLEKEAGGSSLARYKRIGEISKTISREDGHAGDLAKVLRDHENRPHSICKHAEEQKSPEGTVFSVIFEPANFKAYALVGKPCELSHAELEF